MERRGRMPVPAGFVRRPRVDALLTRGLDHALITVVAGSGYEKTRCVAAYMQDAPVRLAWLTMPDSLNDRDWFWAQLVAALAREMPEASARLADAPFPDRGETFDPFARVLARTLYGGPRVVWVIDGYERIQSPDVLLLLDNLLDTGLENLCLLLISGQRTDINARGMRSSGGLLTITAEDLRYTVDEAQALFDAHGTGVTPEETARIVRETDGWPVALTLLAMNRRETPGTYPERSQVPLLVDDLFERECFAGYDEATRQLLIKLSLLPRFPLEVVKGIGGGDLQAAVETIVRHMFIDADLPAGLFTMHAMYRAFLTRKQPLLDSAEVRRVLDLAGAWFLTAGYLGEGLDCPWRSGKQARFLQALWEQPPARRSHDLAQFLLDCLARVRTDDPQAAHGVQLATGLLLLNNGELRRAQSTLETLVESLAALPEGETDDAARQMMGEAYAALAEISMIQNTDAFAAYHEKALAYLPHGSHMRNRTMMLVGNNDVFFVMDDGPDGPARTVEAITRASQAADIINNGAGYGYELLFTAEAAFFTCDVKQAEAFAGATVRKAQVEAQHDIVLSAYQLQMRVALYEGDYARAVHVRDAAIDYADRVNLPEITELCDCVKSFFIMQMGDIDRLPAWMQRYDIDRVQQLPIGVGRNIIYYAIYLMGKQWFAQADDALQRFETVLQARGLWTLRLTSLLMRAVCLREMGRLEDALSFLQRGWDMAAPGGVFMPFIEFGRPMILLLEDARRHGGVAMDDATVEDIIRRAEAYDTRRADMAAIYRRGRRKQPAPSGTRLSRREREVLGLLANGLTREEIARRLGISINGVKKHITGAYNKLGAINRADAIRLATACGEIASGDA